MKLRVYKDAWPHVHDSAYVDPQAAVIGDIKLGADSSIWPMAVVRGDVNSIRIGERTNIQDSTVIHVTHPHAEQPQGFATTIGNDVTIGHRVVLHGCTIGDLCLIGIGAVILDGAVIQDKVLVGAGALVTEGRVLESGHLYLGSPARKVRPLSEAELKWFEYSAQHYVHLKNDYLVSI